MGRPLVGRSAELVERDGVVAELRAHVEAAAGGSGRLVLLRGEAGIGKTSVIQAFIDQLDEPVRVLTGLCDPLTTPVPLGPIVELAHDLGNEIDECLAAAIRGAGGLGAVPPAVFAVLNAATPVVWVVEDMQWADEASLDVLCYIARRVARLSALMVMTYRDDALGPSQPLTALLGDIAANSNVFRIDLPALSLAGVQELSDPYPSVDPAMLHAATGGNAFLVSQALVHEWDGSAPHTLRESVLGRLARLKVDARTVADVVAVLATDASRELIEVISPNSAAALDECISAGILRDNWATVEFRHELVRRTVWEAIPIHRRRNLHGAALTALVISRPRQDSLARLAFHAQEASDIDALVLYAPAAAEEASASGAHQEAAECYMRLVRHAESAPVHHRVEWLEAHSHAEYLCGSADPAAESMVEAARLRAILGDDLGRGDDMSHLARLLCLTAPLAEVRDSADHAIALLEPRGPSAQLAWAYANRAQLACLEYNPSSATHFARLATHLAQAVDDPVVVAWAQLTRSLSEFTGAEGSWTHFEAEWRSALATSGVEEHAAMAATVAGLVTVLRHDHESSDRCARQTSQLCRDNNLIGFELMTRLIAAAASLDQGEHDEAEAVATEILGQATLSRLHHLWAQVIAATARARSNRDGVWSFLDDAVSADGPDDPLRTGIAWAARIEAAWLADDSGRARTETERALASLSGCVDGWIVGRVHAWAQIAGVPLPEPSCLPLGPYAHQLCGDWDAAADLWVEMGCPYNAAIARAHSDTPEASETAIAMLESLGAVAAAARVRSGLRKRRRRLASSSDRFGFTSRERQVAELIARRYSDREIADALFISPKTAGHHVSAIFAKLGVTSRAAARDKLHDSIDVPRESTTID